jgi:hypothetical protein
LSRNISGHNAIILKSDNNNQIPPKECNCRKKDECPVQGKCLQDGVVYQATVNREDGISDTYIGLSAPLLQRSLQKSQIQFQNKKSQKFNKAIEAHLET